MPYLDLETAQRRLRHSVVMHNNQPVWVDEVGLVRDARRVDPADIGPGYNGGPGTYTVPDADLPYREQSDRVRNELRAYYNCRAEEVRQGMIRDRHRELVRHYAAGRPPRAATVEPDQIELLVRNISGGDPRFTVNQMDPLLSLRPVPLGMVNYAGDACGFLERQPVRRYAQGLRVENSSFFDITDGQERGNRGPGYPFDLSRSPQLAATIRGEYPTLGEAMLDLAGSDKPRPCRAFNRNLAVSLDPDLGLVYLHYRRRKIAFSDNGDTFKVSPAYTFMRETLERNQVEARYAA
jgi:hypothetical protein